jgi:hypothetical protein
MRWLAEVLKRIIKAREEESKRQEQRLDREAELRKRVEARLAVIEADLPVVKQRREGR